MIKIAFKSKKEKIAYKIGLRRGKKEAKKDAKSFKKNGDFVSIGKRKNIRVEKTWLSRFKKDNPHADAVIARLSDYKNDKGIYAYSKDQEFLEDWARADKERYEAERHRGSFDTDEFFEAALKRSYSNMRTKKKGR